MDDALVLVIFLMRISIVFWVLILVVMDDALVLGQKAPENKAVGSLNPCCNG